MFSRIKPRIYRKFTTIHDKNYNWRVKKENRITRKNWQEKNKKNLETKNLEKININDKFNENNHSNFPVDLNTVNNWKHNINRDIFLL